MVNPLERVENHQVGETAISPAMQEYLAEVYRIASYQDDGDWVSTSTLAEQAGVSAPAVARMVSRLKKRGLVVHEPYRGMRLTPAGEHEALMAIRRHRLTEAFLVNVMGYGWHEAHDDAERLTVAVTESPRLLDRMDEMAGFPTRCPHGEPIPTREGVMPGLDDKPLSDVEPPAQLAISRVHTRDTERLVYIEALRLKPGQSFELVRRAPFNGPFFLKINGREQIVGAELGQILLVSHRDDSLN